MLWYDYETTGTDPARDRPVQFAALRTDLDLQPVGDPVSVYCRPVRDVLPHPEACIVTGIAPQDAERGGLPEAEFAGAVHELLATPGTCSAGYNTIRFDEEFSRNLFYRNFFDPYEHAWKHSNARWDILDLTRACYALRPDGIEWPLREDGAPSFKLEHLAPANHLEQPRAHDAASDVIATLGLARLLRTAQPRLYDWYLDQRDKKRVAATLAAALPTMQPLLHVSGRYRAARGCLAMVVPVAAHPTRAGSFIVADLSVDPATWAGLDADELGERLFTARADLPDDLERPPLKVVHSNKAPFLAPLSVLQGVDTFRIGLAPDDCRSNADHLRACDGLGERIRQVFADDASRWPAREDPELSIYSGFPSDADRRRFDRVRSTPAAALATTDFGFDDPRYATLLFRYRARNWADTLGAEERERWRTHVREKLTRETEATPLTLAQFFAAIARLRKDVAPGSKQALLDRLQGWGETIRAEFGC